MNFKQLAKETALLLHKHKCEDVLLLDVRNLTTISSYIIIGTITSMPHMKAVYQAVEEFFKNKLNKVSDYTDTSPSWRVLDYSQILINLMSSSSRNFYSLERIWYKAKRINFKDDKGRDQKRDRKSNKSRK